VIIEHNLTIGESWKQVLGSCVGTRIS
jgi:hypothetical protein